MTPLPPLTLPQALRLAELPQPPVVAWVGAGGKTTAMFLAARQAGPAAVVTTTTHLAAAQAVLADQHWIARTPTDLPETFPPGVTLVTSGPAGGGRLGGLPEDVLARLVQLAQASRAPLFIEADGSRTLPLKAPADHEPAIPPQANLVVVVAGLAGLGQPLAPESVHRPERFAALSGLALGEAISLAALATVLCHPAGGLKNIPPAARRVVLLNQADTPDRLAAAHSLSTALLGVFSAVVSASVQTQHIHAVYTPVAGVVLAAGGAARMGGQPKPLLPWRGQPLVWHVIQAALQGGLAPVIVVAGAYASEMQAALAPLLDAGQVHLVENPHWAAGQATSVQAGLAALPENTGAAVFLLSDQPETSPALVRALVEKHAQTLAPIVAPEIDGQRGNPVLFDRQTFSAFAEITGDRGGRALFSRYRAVWVPWHDRRALHDIDTPEDYQRLLEM